MGRFHFMVDETLNTATYSTSTFRYYRGFTLNRAEYRKFMKAGLQVSHFIYANYPLRTELMHTGILNSANWDVRTWKDIIMLIANYS